MSKRKQPGKGGSRNKPRHLRAVPDARGDGPGDQPLIAMLRPSLRSDDPIDFLATVSTLVESVRPPRGPSFAMSSFDGADRPTLEMLVESFIGTSIRETTAALYVIREFIADEVMAARIDRELAQRRQPVPPWIRSLRDTTVTRIVRTVEELGDGENMAIGFQIPDAKPLALIAFIDHNLLSSVKDAFPYPGSIDDFVGYFDSLANADGENIRFEELPDQAIARAAVDRALDRTDMVFPSVTSESWPQCRPWLEWLLWLLPGMPAGMSLYEEEWDHSAIDDLVDGFLRAPEAKSLKYKDTGDMVETLAWLNSADPTRWSPVVVEILLEDRLPRKVIDSPKNLARYPEVLRAFVRYCHRMSEVTSRSTADTLRSIDRSEPRFRQLISGKATSDHPTAAVSAYLRDAIADGVDPADVMNSIISRDIDELDYQAERDTTRSPAVIEALRKIGKMTLDSLARAVGGAEKLRGLTADPLPDEPFDWSGVPQEIRGPSARCSRCATTPRTPTSTTNTEPQCGGFSQRARA